MTKSLLYIWFLFILIGVPVSGCSEGGDSVKIVKGLPAGIDSLAGTWVRQTRTGQAYEQWRKVNDTLWTGVAWRMKGSDSTLMESLRIFLYEGKVYYAPTVPDQNDGKEVLFLWTGAAGGFTFENAAHDFPNRIIYTFPAAGEMRVAVEDNSGKKRILFNFYRLEQE